MFNKIKKNSKYIMLIILYLISIIFFISIIKSNVINNLFIFTIFLVILFFNTIISYTLIKNNKKIIITFCYIISILLMFIYFMGTIYINKTRSFLENITTLYTYKTYSVVVKKNSSYRKIVNLKNSRIGFLLDDYNVNLKTIKNDNNMDFYSKKYINNDALIDSLDNDLVDAISVSKGYVDGLTQDDSFDSKYRIIDTYSIKVKENSKKIGNMDKFVFYISGSDSENVTNDLAESDVNIIAVVNSKKKKILFVHIPKDYYVQLHGTSGRLDRLSSASLYGINMSMLTVNDLLDTNSDYYFRLYIDSLVGSVDLVGGIDIESSTSFTTEDGCSFNTSINHVDGRCALAYIREKKAFDNNEGIRDKNVEQVINKLIEKFSDTKYLLKYNEILDSLNGSFKTNMRYDDITTFIKNNFTTLNKFEVENYNLDGYTGSMLTYTTGVHPVTVVIPNGDTVDIAREKIKEYLK